MKEKRSEKTDKIVIVSAFLILILTPFLGALVGSLFNADKPIPRYMQRPNPTPWQLVTVEDIGSIYVPGHWVITRQDDVIYMTDKPIDEENYTIYFVGVVYDKGQTTERDDTLHSILGKYIHLSSNYYLAEPNYGPKKWSRDTFKIDDVVTELFVIELEDTRCLYMVAWDNAVDVSIIRRVVTSFSASGEYN